MKRLVPFFALLLVASACEVYVVEPRFDIRDGIIGEYSVREYSETYREVLYYSFTIRKSAVVDKIFIDNFYGANVRVEAYIDHNQIIIPYQVTQGYEIEGVGSLSATFIDFSYSVRDLYDDSYTDFCDAEASRY
jgi:hypothetical protein